MDKVKKFCGFLDKVFEFMSYFWFYECFVNSNTTKKYC